MVNLLHLVLLRRRALTLGSNAQVGTRATFVARGKYTATGARAGVRTPGRFCSRLGYDTTNGLSATASERYAALFRAKWVHVIIIDQTMSLPPLADCKAIEVYIRDKGLNDEAMLLEHVVLCFSAFVADLKAKRLTATQQATLEYGDDHDTIIRIISQFIAETMCRILTEISPTLLTWSSIFLPPVYFNHRCVDYFAGRVGVVCGFKIGFQTSTLLIFNFYLLP